MFYIHCGCKLPDEAQFCFQYGKNIEFCMMVVDPAPIDPE